MNAPITSSSLHALLLLSDSALPLGSFAFSSGLESFIAHRRLSNTNTKLQDFDRFLELSLSNLASTALPYVLTAYESPERTEELDNDFDASTPCTVARRASVSQGRALLTIWERALSTSTLKSPFGRVAASVLQNLVTTVKTVKPDCHGLQLNAHFAPLFGVVCAALGLSADDTTYLFLLNHAKALLSAAVRASVMGPYQSQAVMASGKLRDHINVMVVRERATPVEDSRVTVPALDLWAGRHELLYSRIFNS